MFKHVLGATALLAASLPSAAFAGIGATASLGGLTDGTAWAPSLDWREKGIHVSLQAFDTIGGLTEDRLNLGLGAAFVAVKRQIAPEVEGTFSPGARVRYLQYMGDTGEALDKAKLQSSGFNVTGEFRMGMEMKKGMGFGVYVVPQLGVSNLFTIATTPADDAEIGLTYGGGVEVSVWFLKK